jgi:hypothetical protein
MSPLFPLPQYSLHMTTIFSCNRGMQDILSTFRQLVHHNVHHRSDKEAMSKVRKQEKMSDTDLRFTAYPVSISVSVRVSTG